MTPTASPQPSAPPRQTLPKDIASADEKSAMQAVSRVKKLIKVQSWVMGVLALVFCSLLPFANPIYVFYARKPDGQVMQMVGLDIPNMTNRAILSWSATAITEIMTMGFGDVDIRLPRQKWRFTEKGWDAYIAAFVEQKIGETFKRNQLVLTTVPSNTPVILSQGVNPDEVYQWTVQMPVIMTYVANNLSRKQKAVVTLTIVRAPPEQSPSGVAIRDWVLE